MSRTRRDRFFDVLSKARVRRGAAIMGVCNVTPDSFSDGGLYFDLEAAKRRVDALISEGADVVDIGGESTRPGATAVSATEQLARVLPVVRYAAERVAVSIDTTSAEVAHASLDAGALCVNDVSLLRGPWPRGRRVLALAPRSSFHTRAFRRRKCGALAASQKSTYADVVADVLADFTAARNKAAARGVPADAVIMDPGLGFSKSARHSMELLRRTHELVARADAPVLVGASRKSFLTLFERANADGSVSKPEDRLGASVLAAVFAVRAGAAAVRVHDVLATRQALELDVILDTPHGHGDGQRVRDARRRGDGGDP